METDFIPDCVKNNVFLILHGKGAIKIKKKAIKYVTAK